MSTTVLDRFLDPVTDCLTPAVAERIVGVRVDPQTQTRLDELAEKATVDPVTGAVVPIFNPRRDRWSEHFAAPRSGA